MLVAGASQTTVLAECNRYSHDKAASRPRPTAPACNRPRLGQLAFSIRPGVVSQVVAGSRQAGPFQRLAGFRRPVVRRGEEDSRIGTRNCYYMAYVCFWQPVRTRFLVSRLRNGRRVWYNFRQLDSSLRVTPCFLPRKPQWWCKVDTPSPVISLHGSACHDIRTCQCEPMWSANEPQVCWASWAWRTSSPRYLQSRYTQR